MQTSPPMKVVLLSTDQEMKRMSDMKLENPQKLKVIFEKGEMLVLMAQRGELRKMLSVINSLDENEFIPLHFMARMLKGSLCAGHLLAAASILDIGYPIRNNKIPCVLHECLSEMKDELAVDVVNFLVSKGFDINMQVHPNWLTTLHIAVKHQLLETTRLLLSLGADVNAVAKDDIMPLNIIEKIENSIPSETETKDSIINLLKQKGAKSSWRSSRVTFSGGSLDPITTSDAPVTVIHGCNIMQNTLVSFRGGGSGVGADSNVIKSEEGMTVNLFRPVVTVEHDLKPFQYNNNRIDNTSIVKDEIVILNTTMSSLNVSLPCISQEDSTHANDLDRNSSGPTFSQSDDGGYLFST